LTEADVFDKCEVQLKQCNESYTFEHMALLVSSLIQPLQLFSLRAHVTLEMMAAILKTQGNKVTAFMCRRLCFFKSLTIMW